MTRLQEIKSITDAHWNMKHEHAVYILDLIARMRRKLVYLHEVVDIYDPMFVNSLNALLAETEPGEVEK